MDQGFRIIPALLTAAEISRLRSDVEALPRGRAGARNVLSQAAIRMLADDARLVTLAGECWANRLFPARPRPLLLHASSKSITALPRRVIHIEYATSVILGSGLELAVA